MRALLSVLALVLAAAAAAQPGGTELDRAYDQFVAAHLALKKAEETRELGVEPQPGERIATRLTDEYWARQKQLEDEVERARKRLDEAIARWNNLR